MNSESNDEHPEPQDAEEFVAELVIEASNSDVPFAVTEVAAVPAVAYNPSILIAPKATAARLPPSPMTHLAAKGGAVGAMVLGVLAFVGSFITSYAILNSIMGLALGLWGLKSDHRRTAMLGMALCLIAAFFCVVEISSWLQTLWPSEEPF